MEFRFNLNEVFKAPIVEIGNQLIPSGFRGDRRQLWDTVSKVTDVINAMGQESAAAQGLSKSITTADKLRNSDNQKVYLLFDFHASQGHGKGAVTGLLKTGYKSLYVFDREGHNHHVQAPCILDFYIHESVQRSGFGKKLFEHMLQEEGIEPQRLAIDRPSDKFLSFLKKHYNLSDPIQQMNNFVVFNGFFQNKDVVEGHVTLRSSQSSAASSPSRDMRGTNGLQNTPMPTSAAYGRYGAHHPACSMGQIIHNQSAAVNPTESSGPRTPRSESPIPLDFEETSPKLDRPQSLSLTSDGEENQPNDVEVGQDAEHDDDVDSIEMKIGKTVITIADRHPHHDQHVDRHPHHDQHVDEGILSAGKGRKTPGLTDQGHFDLKFYHNKLW